MTTETHSEPASDSEVVTHLSNNYVSSVLLESEKHNGLAPLATEDGMAIASGAADEPAERPIFNCTKNNLTVAPATKSNTSCTRKRITQNLVKSFARTISSPTHGNELTHVRTQLPAAETHIRSVSTVTSPTADLQNMLKSRLADADTPSAAVCNGLAFSDADKALLKARSASFPSLCATPAQKYKVVKEGLMHVCRIQHAKTVLSKLATNKFLRRWETHHLVLGPDSIYSKTPVGFMENSVRYAVIDDVHVMSGCGEHSDRFCLRLYVPEGSVLLEAKYTHVRNQWLHSILWKRNMYRYWKTLESVNRTNVIMKEVTNMLKYVQTAQIHSESAAEDPMELIAFVLQKVQTDDHPRQLFDSVLLAASPLFEHCSPTNSLAAALTQYCCRRPRSPVVDSVFTHVTHQILKRNMDFGKYPSMRSFVQQFLIAISSHNCGMDKIRNFVRRAHGDTSLCPHPRVLQNFVSVCLATIRILFEDKTATNHNDAQSAESALFDSFCPHPMTEEDLSLRVDCFTTILNVIAEFEDWRLPVASILQPVPFPRNALSHPVFAKNMALAVQRIGLDSRCEVHLAVLAVRMGREGWLQMYCPGGVSCLHDEGETFATVLKCLLQCCCKRRSFLQTLSSLIGPLQLLSLRECESAMDALCAMLEWSIVETEDMKIQMIAALQSSPAGKKRYIQLCDRQIALRELQQKGGPRKLTLPSKSTDQDLGILLSSGPFGNLEWLSLAFTDVTSNCAEFLIKLPSLKYLNLWSTQFGDHGLQLLSENLTKLQVLNLCETPVSDRGLISLKNLRSLRKLNLNSTLLSSKTFEAIRAALPALQEVDIRYTEAWCADDISNASNNTN